MVPPKSIHLCWICDKSIDLTDCKTDEHGKAVHEACYAAKIALESGARKGPVSFTVAVRFKGDPITRHRL